MDITAKQLMLIDPSELAEVIEQRYGTYLIPYEQGYYLPGSALPAMKAGRYYTYKDAAGIEYSVSTAANICDIKSHIYDEHGEIVVDRRKIRQLTTVPHAPYRSITLIRDLIENCIDRMAVWRQYAQDKPAIYTPEDVVASHLDPAYVSKLKKDDPSVALLAEQIIELIIDLRTSAVNFVGEDKWTIHMVRVWRNDIIIEKMQDYRIFAWEKEHLKK